MVTDTPAPLQCYDLLQVEARWKIHLQIVKVSQECSVHGIGIRNMCSHGEEEWWWKFWGSSWLTMINTIGCNTEDDDDNIWCRDDTVYDAVWWKRLQVIAGVCTILYSPAMSI